MKNKILKSITYLNGAIFLFFACALDSDTWIPYVACCISGAWLALFAYANNMFYGMEGNKK